MDKCINLSLTGSLPDFGALLKTAIRTVPSKVLSLTQECDDGVLWKFRCGEHVQIDNDKDGYSETARFWMGFGLPQYDKYESCISIEFNANMCGAKYWDKVNQLVGTAGKFFSEVRFEFSQEHRNAWVNFYLGEEFRKQFFDKDAETNAQREILTGFANEVVEKL